MASRNHIRDVRHHLAADQITFPCNAEILLPMYVKLFKKITYSSINYEPIATRWAWVILLANMDQDFRVECAGVKGLARMANITLDQAKEAEKILSSEDPESSNPNNKGKRIEIFPWGYEILNGAEYRRLRDREMQRELTRNRVRKHRETKECNAESVTKRYKPLPSVTSTSTSSLEDKKKLNKETVWEELKANPAYEGIDLEKEFFKMEAWCKANGKVPSHRRFINWLNRAEKPLKIAKTQPFKASDEEWDKLPDAVKKQLIENEKVSRKS